MRLSEGNGKKAAAKKMDNNVRMAENEVERAYTQQLRYSLLPEFMQQCAQCTHTRRSINIIVRHDI